MTLGIMALLKKKGFRVAPFKVGPDYIDPGHHRRITGTPSRNLDGWMLSRQYNLECFENGMRNKDIAVVEGVMGLYDGYDGKSEAGSTAQMAKWLGLPVILVVNAQSMARSGAALVRGFEQFDTDLEFAGVIFNKLGSKRHLRYLTEALEGNVSMPCLGGIMRSGDIEIPERHLGLVTDDERGLTEVNITRLSDIIEDGVYLEDLLPLEKLKREGLSSVSSSGVQVRIGVARDKAFCFYYPDNLEILEKNGAELVYFSPIEDTSLPEGLDGIYLGGGYPELFAEKLSQNGKLLQTIQAKSKAGMPIYGECGGFMYLCKDIQDKEGSVWPMTGCFPFSAIMLNKLKSLGYREITLNENTVIGNAGDMVRGHEFHYSRIEEQDYLQTMYAVTPRAGGVVSSEGYLVNNTLGSYIHLHFGSKPEAGTKFIESCKHYKKERTRS